MKYAIILFLCFFAGLKLFAQKKLEGKILDHDSLSGVPGVNIWWEGTTSGTATNAAGYFVLNKTKKSSLLILSFVGYKTDTIQIDPSLNYIEHTLEIQSNIGEVSVFGRTAGTHINRIDPQLSYNITGAELSKAACCNLSESFTTNASVDVSFSDALTGAKQIQLLGLAGSYVQIMTENFPTLYGLGSAFGLNYIPGPWMESIQVSKGTSSVRNGYDAISGQINVEFKKPADSELLYINLYGNSSGKAEANLNTSIKLSDRLSTAFFAHGENDQLSNDQNKDGFRDEPDLKQYHFFNRWDYMTDRVHLRAGFRIMDEERVGGELSYNPSELTSGSYGIFINTLRAEGFTKSGIIFPRDRSMSLGWINNFSFHDQSADYGANTYSGIQRSYYSNLLYQWKPGLANHTLDAGISYKYDSFNEELNSNNTSRTETVPGVFFQYSYSDTALITVLAGIRADHHNLFGTFITPRIHFRYKLSENITLRANAGKGFRSSNVIAEKQYLLASSRVINFIDDPELEEAWNFGLSISSNFTPGNTDLSLSADYFQTRFINQIVTDLDSDVGSILIYNLDGKSVSNVLQLEAQWDPSSRLDILLALRWNDVKMTTGGVYQQRALSSQYKALLTGSYLSNLRRWQYDLTLQLNGPGRVPSTQSNPEAYQRDDSFDAYPLLNAQISRKFKNFDIYLGAENLTNFKQEDPIISADNPFGDNFDASLVWGPLMGRMIYGGIRIAINRN